MPLYGLAPGLLVEGVGETWAVFSPLTGQTVLVNDESAAILEVLRDAPESADGVCSRLAADLEIDDLQALSEAVRGAWTMLRQSGLIVRVDAPSA